MQFYGRFHETSLSLEIAKDKQSKWNLKFIYSEKATKILRNLHLFLTGTSTSKVEISQTFCGLLRIYELYLTSRCSSM